MSDLLKHILLVLLIQLVSAQIITLYSDLNKEHKTHVDNVLTMVNSEPRFKNHLNVHSIRDLTNSDGKVYFDVLLKITTCPKDTNKLTHRQECSKWKRPTHVVKCFVCESVKTEFICANQKEFNQETRKLLIQDNCVLKGKYSFSKTEPDVDEQHGCLGCI